MVRRPFAGALSTLAPSVAWATGLLNEIRAGNFALMKKLMAGGADVNAKTGDTTALMHAVMESDLIIVKALVAAGAKVNAANEAGSTTLISPTGPGSCRQRRLPHALLFTVPDRPSVKSLGAAAPIQPQRQPGERNR
jgi:hypothetical protein